MGFKEAFTVAPKGKDKEVTMEVNANAFQVGGRVEQQAADRIKFIQENLDYMQKRLKPPLNSDELKVAWLAIERELEEVKAPKSVQDIIREQNVSQSEAVNIALGNILTGVEDFVRTRLQTVIDIVDDEDWIGSVSKDEAGTILTDIEKSRDANSHLSAQAIQEFKNRYAHPNLLEQGGRGIASGSSMRSAADEAMGMR